MEILSFSHFIMFMCVCSFYEMLFLDGVFWEKLFPIAGLYTLEFGFSDDNVPQPDCLINVIFIRRSLQFGRVPPFCVGNQAMRGNKPKRYAKFHGVTVKVVIYQQHDNVEVHRHMSTDVSLPRRLLLIQQHSSSRL